MGRGGEPLAKKLTLYAAPAWSWRALSPIITSQAFVVPPGTCAQARPSTRDMVVPAAHHGSVVVSKVPLLICSLPVGSSAAEALGELPTTAALSAAAATAAAVTAATVRRRFGGLDTENS